MIVQAVAWDIDGTLLDSEPRHHRALVGASRLWNVDLSDLPNLPFRGVHMQDVWAILRERYPASLQWHEWMAAINAHYVEDTAPMNAMPQAVETIRALAAQGVPQICVSNSGRLIVDANIRALGIADCLVASISLDDVSAGKPDPAPYRDACRLLGLPPRQVAAVEDSATGLASAKMAGLYTIAYRIEDATADRRIARLDEVLAL
ncbi:HAD family hydrolase [Oceanibaculum pacificum]|uniref:HAD family hydrolase n=1 Tax=Oceanibaculum pacificum TaxID=580166 RepID=A0A154W7M3_9PROT|nr:HAD family phosphatase [Oceanibaculum pacificum]KZD09501.1 HAD family hydrolase [Oceanibaculum pacificum]